MIRIGAHCSMKSPLYLEGSVNEALSYDANALMIYTGPPQNTKRSPVEALHIERARELMRQHGMTMDAMVVHAPYIINLGNSVNPSTYDLAINFLRMEIERVQCIGAKYIVLHPGSHTTGSFEDGVRHIIDGLNQILKPSDTIMILLETMAGKGSEIGKDLETLKWIKDHVHLSDHIGFCVDTCHMHDGGYDLSNVDQWIDTLDATLGLTNIPVMHINDSKNPRGSHKDRHANIGKGYIGFTTLYTIVNHPRLEHVIKILETPYIDGNPPYGAEIKALRSNDPNALPEGGA